VAQRIGIDRVPKLVSPTVTEYLTMRGTGIAAPVISPAHNGTPHNGVALDLQVEQTNEASDADPAP
jgi:hypothetical protein